MLTKEQLMSLREKIAFIHLGGGSSPIPLSTAVRDGLFSEIIEDAAERDRALYFLNEAHYIFIMMISEDESDSAGSGIRGYIIADPHILRKLIDGYGSVLIELYEAEKFRRKEAMDVLEELLPMLKSREPSPLTDAVKIYSMLRQFHTAALDQSINISDIKRQAILTNLLGNPDTVDPFEIIAYTGEEVGSIDSPAVSSIPSEGRTRRS